VNSPLRAVRIALLAAALTLAMAAGASAATVIHFQPESISALKVQLGKHEVHAVTFHPVPAPGHVHVSMNDGRHFTVVYTTAEQAQLVALARANGARYAVAVAKPKAAAKPVHHTLRYVAGGILVLVIVVVAAVLLVDRRRKLGEEEDGSGGDATPPQSQPSP
jgi:predicted metal-binding membrane protein